jgi:hypothetical protein
MEARWTETVFLGRGGRSLADDVGLSLGKEDGGPSETGGLKVATGGMTAGLEGA